MTPARSVGLAAAATAGALVLEGYRRSLRRVQTLERRLSRFADEEGEQRARVAARRRVDRLLDRRALHTVFQPIVDVDSRRVVGAEALMRVDLDARGPEPWLRDAALAGRGADLERLALETALCSARELPPRLYVSVNVSPPTLTEPWLLDVLTGSGLPAERIVLELTEHASVDDYSRLAAPLERLRARGVRLAVDDAGAGFASFRHILQLRPDLIKLDGAITHDLDSDPSRRALAAAVVMFALEMRCTVVAEGVETPAELQTVSSLGIDAAQGHLLGSPTGDLGCWTQWAESR